MTMLERPMPEHRELPLPTQPDKWLGLHPEMISSSNNIKTPAPAPERQQAGTTQTGAPFKPEEPPAEEILVKKDPVQPEEEEGAVLPAVPAPDPEPTKGGTPPMTALNPRPKTVMMRWKKLLEQQPRHRIQ